MLSIGEFSKICKVSTKTLRYYAEIGLILSMLLGIALDKGYIKNLDEKVIDFFPNYTIKKREKTFFGYLTLLSSRYIMSV